MKWKTYLGDTDEVKRLLSESGDLRKSVDMESGTITIYGLKDEPILRALRTGGEDCWIIRAEIEEAGDDTSG